jgi:rhodanese-related sulfurtransferase
VIDARNVPSADLSQSVETLKKYREKPVLTCCETGMTASAAARTLREQGFSKVASLRGGLQAWRAETCRSSAATPRAGDDDGCGR